MKRRFSKLSLLGALTGVFALAFGAVASAHVVVKPAEVTTATFQTFAMGVPNEKDMPTTSVKLVIPSGLQYISPTQKPGWEITTEKEGSGEDATVKSITWSGSLGVGFRDEFTFSAKTPDKLTDLQWKAYQTYEDGTVVSWDQASEGGHDEEGGNSGPFSVTKVVAQSSQDAATQKADQAAADAKTAANRALYVAIAGAALGLVAIFLATRKK